MAERSKMTKRIGVLALQGGVAEHCAKIRAVGGEPIRVRTAAELQALDGIILPGGESTAIGRILRRNNLLEPLRTAIEQGLPVWGTCAGLILLAREVAGGTTHLGVMDIAVRRNAYGSQLASFSATQTIPAISAAPQELIFIRAPIIERVGAGVDILLQTAGAITCAREGQMLATTFHPELAPGSAVHDYFIRELC